VWRLIRKAQERKPSPRGKPGKTSISASLSFYLRSSCESWDLLIWIRRDQPSHHLCVSGSSMYYVESWVGCKRSLPLIKNGCGHLQSIYLVHELLPRNIYPLRFIQGVYSISSKSNPETTATDMPTRTSSGNGVNRTLSGVCLSLIVSPSSSFLLELRVSFWVRRVHGTCPCLQYCIRLPCRREHAGAARYNNFIDLAELRAVTVQYRAVMNL
jgi:hypothetical protein